MNSVVLINIYSFNGLTEIIIRKNGNRQKLQTGLYSTKNVSELKKKEMTEEHNKLSQQ